MSKIKNKAIPYSRHFINNDNLSAVVKVLKSKNLTQGKTVEIFEKKIAKYVGSKYAVAVSSATAGLHIACKTLNFNEKSNLLTSVISFVSSSNIAYFLGGKADFVDIDQDSVSMNIKNLEEKIKKNKPNILIPVHMGGASYNYKELRKLSKKYKFKIIEDAAHSFGGAYDKLSKIGSCKYSDMTIFSFHPAKTITTGEGGVITTNNKEYYLQLLRLRSHGINKKNDLPIIKKQAYTNTKINQWYYEMRTLGYNYRLTDIQSALGISQMTILNKILKKKQKIFKLYDQVFSNQKKITPLQVDKRNLTSYHLYIVQINFIKIGKSRRELMEILEKNKIFCQVHYIPIVKHPFYQKKGFSMKSYPNAKRYYDGCLTLPCFYSLTKKDQMFVIKVILDYLK
jgi:perosamine synthetase